MFLNMNYFFKIILTVSLTVTTLSFMLLNDVSSSSHDTLTKLNVKPELLKLHSKRKSAKLYIREADAVLSKRNATKQAIYFIETSMNGIVRARQVCAIESTARVYPDADIYLLVLSPPNEINFDLNQALLKVMRHHKNINVLSVELVDYFQGSPLDKWVHKLEKSRFPQHQISDVLRLITLWKYGGMYFDLDVVLTRKLDCEIFLVKASTPKLISNGSGPPIITNTMMKYCGVSSIEEMTRAKCKGVAVLPPNTFYPIPFPEWQLYFNETNREKTMKRLRSSIGLHVWNKLSSESQIYVDSQQPYGLLAQQFCPRSYWSSHTLF